MTDKNTMLPGFHLYLADTIEEIPEKINVKDVFAIYGILPERMKSIDDFGDEEETYFEPNKLHLISSPSDAIKTLETTNLVLTREIKNIIRLLPDGASVGLVRIVKRDGENPNPKSLTELYEALDYAFENTENAPIGEIILAGISLDDMVSLDPTTVQIEAKKEDFEGFKEVIKTVQSYNTGTGIISDKKFNLTLRGTKSTKSQGESTDGIHDEFQVLINGEVAKVITEDGLKDFDIKAELSYSGLSGSKTFTVDSVTTDITGYANLEVVGNKLTLKVLKDTMLKLDDETVIKLQTGDVAVLAEKKSNATVEESLNLVKLSDSASILKRTLLHNHRVTSTQNNCLTFASPKPPKSLSNKDIEAYVDRCEALYEKIREQAVIADKKGKRVDLGRYFSCPLGVNQFDGLGGLIGFPSAKIATISTNKIVTKKPTSAFSLGDMVEVYTHNKMDTLVHVSEVTKVVISDNNTVEITLKDEVPTEISSGINPKYIQNVNNKDFNGTYLARQYSLVVRQAGVDRSPAGIPWRGNCQLRFSEKQLQRLDYRKFCVLQQEHGQSVGSVSRSQLMTDSSNVFQNIETIVAVYDLISKSKDIAMPYRGKRIDDGLDLALIKTQIDEGVFKPAVNVYILPGYTLELTLRRLVNPNGVKEKALFINFEFTEIETLKLIRMQVRVL